MNHGKRNLMILGIGAILITGASTSLSLWLYRTSGDIYLDRSRPGYLPDKEEVKDETEVTGSSYVFSESGALDKKDLDEYLKELELINNRIQALSDPYGSNPLSDESLGIAPIQNNPSEDK